MKNSGKNEEEITNKWNKTLEQLISLISLSIRVFLSVGFLGVIPVSIPIDIDPHWKTIYLIQYFWSLIKQNYTNFTQPLPVVETRHKK